MKTKIRRGLLVIILISVSFLGCDKLSRMGISGTYVSEKNEKNFMELKTNGSFYVHENGMGMAGSYEIDGDQITLKTDMGFASRGKVDGNTLIDDDGERWTKK
jgi:hypothetical protein